MPWGLNPSSGGEEGHSWNCRIPISAPPSLRIDRNSHRNLIKRPTRTPTGSEYSSISSVTTPDLSGDHQPHSKESPPSPHTPPSSPASSYPATKAPDRSAPSADPHSAPQSQSASSNSNQSASPTPDAHPSTAEARHPYTFAFNELPFTKYAEGSGLAGASTPINPIERNHHQLRKPMSQQSRLLTGATIFFSGFVTGSRIIQKSRCCTRPNFAPAAHAAPPQRLRQQRKTAHHPGSSK